MQVGTRIGAYEIIARLGEGGMGEVYRARDTKLNRDVALKVLLPEVANDPERLARFRREAQVLASLNHPHIGAIHGLEEGPAAFDSAQAGEAGPHATALHTIALVLELVEGPTLADRIVRGPVPLDEALPIAKQIAEALEAAHEQGIVHRDLKPANIKVRDDGTVKVLDFGLAVFRAGGAGGAGGSGGDLTNSPTLTSPALMPFDYRSGQPEQGRGLTGVGMILGTAAYMAPEQAKGKPVDRRADIWAFGVVLYEMLTGRRLFDPSTFREPQGRPEPGRGTTSSESPEGVMETLAAVLTRDVSMKALPAAIPARVRALLGDCLVRDPRQRLRDIGDARLVLDRIIAGAPDDAIEATGATAAVGGSRSHVFPWAIASALAVVVLGMLILWAPGREQSPTDRPLVQLDVDLGPDVAIPPPWGSIAISPDGTRLVFASGTPSKLFTRRLDQPNASELPGTQSDRVSGLFFSPDGQWIGFSSGGQVKKISVEGGGVVTLAESVGFAGVNWAEDGSFVMARPFGQGLDRVAAEGSSPTPLAAAVDGAATVAPHLLPGGRAVLFAACASSGADSCNIEVLTLADGHRKVLARGGHSPHYVPSSSRGGHLVYLNRSTLFATAFNPVTLETSGTAVPVLTDVGYDNATGAGHFHVSRTGTLIYRRARAEAVPLATVQWVDSAGKKTPLRGVPAAYSDVKISPDGKRIALATFEGESRDIWLHDPERNATTRLTFGDLNRYPQWSPDGQYVVFGKFVFGIHQARADGASQPQPLLATRVNQVPWSFTPDGKRLAYVEANQIWTVPLQEQGGQLKSGTPELFLKSTFGDQTPSFSPDGRWLAYTSNESGKSEVYVRAFAAVSPGQGGKWQISNNGGENPQWSRTGHELVYRSGEQLMTVSYSANGDAFVAERPRVWIAALGGTMWDLAPDGKRVAVLIPEATAQAAEREHVIVMLQNFSDELRRRVPLGK